jgi:hypothetical protein
VTTVGQLIKDLQKIQDPDLEVYGVCSSYGITYRPHDPKVVELTGRNFQTYPGPLVEEGLRGTQVVILNLAQ